MPFWLEVVIGVIVVWILIGAATRDEKSDDHSKQNDGWWWP